ncbi:hypothetical protein H257_16542 [Aphanomyces astaci]|uniref:RRM domain-containing protein n=1 Tax=Aphanomyces astaci TaxID=112090 RepID=W4FI08_APHAT|nr:hypothetical protein H257_16542 [Aphanomyces astaci]ETV67132.1 hypothetical protein H257_16542 [Aphanomyces astaci]|eukprot:XP_009843298.1 hypothetical protein H257_16542 [Aphanomyces astaci]
MSDSDSDSGSSGDEQAFFKQPAAPSSKKAQTSSSKAKVAEAINSDDESSSDDDEGADDSSALDKAQLEEDAAAKTQATVYVEGISYDADESALVTHFADCGTVKEVRLPRYQDSGKPRGYAHVVFDSDKAVSKALELDGKYMMKRYLTVRPAETPRGIDQAVQSRKHVKVTKGCRTVYIKQLPYEVDEDTVKTALASCGVIVSVRLPMWGHTKKLKGFGYVEFADEASAVNAAKRSGMKIGNRMVLIDLDTGAPKASFRQTNGQYWNKGEEGKASLAKRMNDKGKNKRLATEGRENVKKHKRPTL